MSNLIIHLYLLLVCYCCELVTARATQVAMETVTEAVDAGTPTAAVAVPAVVIPLIIVIIIVVVIWLRDRPLQSTQPL